jgi:hypothetical protein
MMKAAKKEHSEDSQASCLPIGNYAKVEDGGHKGVPEPHHDGPEKKCKSRESDNSQYYP